MVSRPVDIGTPSGSGLRLERPTGRESSSKAQHTGNPALWTARHGHILAEHEHPKPAQTLSQQVMPDDIALTQAWLLLPEETKGAFGHLFSRMAMRLLRSIPTSKVEL